MNGNAFRDALVATLWLGGDLDVPEHCELVVDIVLAMPEMQELLAKAAEIERLRTAGDSLAHTLAAQSEWTCCADGWFGPYDCPPGTARQPTNGRVATALDTWKEVRRG